MKPPCTLAPRLVRPSLSLGTHTRHARAAVETTARASHGA